MTVRHDPAAVPVLEALRARGIRTGLLSNTHWPRSLHERWLADAGLLELLDVRLYTSDMAHMKPHPEAFRALLDAVGVAPERAVFVGVLALGLAGGDGSLSMAVDWKKMPLDASTGFYESASIVYRLDARAGCTSSSPPPV